MARKRVATTRAEAKKWGEPQGASAALSPEDEQRRKRYIGNTIREQYLPVASSCYEQLLEREPEATGTVEVAFDIAGYGDAGVVDHVELKDGTTIADAEFALCMRESLYTAVFETPPPGASDTTVEFHVDLSP